MIKAIQVFKRLLVAISLAKWKCGKLLTTPMGKILKNKKTFSNIFPTGSVDQAVSHISTWPAADSFFNFLKKKQRNPVISMCYKGGRKAKLN